jgi:hypothetical protein
LSARSRRMERFLDVAAMVGKTAKKTGKTLMFNF